MSETLPIGIHLSHIGIDGLSKFRTLPFILISLKLSLTQILNQSLYRSTFPLLNYKNFQDLSLKGLQSCDFLTQDQQMDILRTFISHYGFQIHHVPHDGIFAGDAHPSMNLPGLTGNV
jgi:hypothetical protein